LLKVHGILQVFSGKKEEEDGDECDILDMMNVSLLFFNNNFHTRQIPRHYEHCRRRRIYTILLHLQLHPLIIRHILLNPSSRLLLIQEQHNLSLLIATIVLVVVVICIPLFLRRICIPLFLCPIGVNRS
jgi:hypothetical protein